MDTIVEETDTQTETDPNAAKGFGEIMQERLAEKSQPKETTKPAEPTKETAPVKEEAKDVTKPAAVTPVDDLLDAAFSGEPAKEKVEEATSPVEEFKDVTAGVTSEKVRERMVKMREKIDTLWKESQTLSRERADLQAKVKPALEDPDVQALIKAKDEELSRANEALLALNIDSHPEFKREFTIPREKHARNAAQKLQSYGGNGQALLDALYMPEGIRRDEAVAQLLESVPDYAKTKITGIISQIETLDEQAGERRANAPKTWEELNAKDLDSRRKKAEEYRGQVTTVFEDIKGQLSQDPVFRQLSDDIKGASEWNKDRDAAFERGLNHILGSDNTVQRSLITAIKGERFDAVKGLLVKERELRKAAERKVAEYEGVQPTVRGGKMPASKEGEEEKDLGFGDIVARRASRRSEGDD